jgi:hypothetical protein
MSSCVRIKKKIGTLSAEDREKFLSNKSINPLTNRTIDPNGPTAQALQAICNETPKARRSLPDGVLSHIAQMTDVKTFSNMKVASKNVHKVLATHPYLVQFEAEMSAAIDKGDKEDQKKILQGMIKYAKEHSLSEDWQRRLDVVRSILHAPHFVTYFDHLRGTDMLERLAKKLTIKHIDECMEKCKKKESCRWGGFSPDKMIEVYLQHKPLRMYMLPLIKCSMAVDGIPYYGRYSLISRDMWMDLSDEERKKVLAVVARDEDLVGDLKNNNEVDPEVKKLILEENSRTVRQKGGKQKATAKHAAK